MADRAKYLGIRDAQARGCGLVKGRMGAHRHGVRFLRHSVEAGFSDASYHLVIMGERHIAQEPRPVPVGYGSHSKHALVTVAAMAHTRTGGACTVSQLR